ncbi:hypothetical protein JKP88DRAFT_352281 [Tribonema minus]|uniref:Uncharacterized protein n=1 Tax=Tribonema minus TaxID=303371 RepID=A0A835ZMR1_9STRA|nr:hypothetical protein JKP88DRAFT_352281 [Tribonema minus]
MGSCAAVAAAPRWRGGRAAASTCCGHDALMALRSHAPSTRQQRRRAAALPLSRCRLHTRVPRQNALRPRNRRACASTPGAAALLSNAISVRRVRDDVILAARAGGAPAAAAGVAASNFFACASPPSGASEAAAHRRRCTLALRRRSAQQPPFRICVAAGHCFACEHSLAGARRTHGAAAEQ